MNFTCGIAVVSVTHWVFVKVSPKNNFLVYATDFH